MTNDLGSHLYNSHCEGWVDTSKAAGSWGFMNHSHRLKPSVQRARECRPMVEGDIS